MSALNFFKTKGFSPKKSTPRKASSLSNLAAALDISERAKEFGIDYGTTSLKLDGNELRFVNGKWKIGEVGSSNDEEIEQLRQENKRLAEENNMLQLKNDILVDMLTESTVESQILEKERDHARKMKGRS